MSTPADQDLPAEVAAWWAENLARPADVAPSAALFVLAARQFLGRDVAADGVAAAVRYAYALAGV